MKQMLQNIAWYHRNLSLPHLHIDQEHHEKTSEERGRRERAFRLFMRLRLRSQLQEGDGRVRVADLGPAERDLLRHALHQVKKFQQWLTLHFRLRQ